MALIVIEHPGLDNARSVVDAVSLPEWAAVGWREVGPACDVPGSTLTDAEWAADQSPREQDNDQAAPQPLEGE